MLLHPDLGKCLIFLKPHFFNLQIGINIPLWRMIYEDQITKGVKNSVVIFSTETDKWISMDEDRDRDRNINDKELVCVITEAGKSQDLQEAS